MQDFEWNRRYQILNKPLLKALFANSICSVRKSFSKLVFLSFSGLLLNETHSKNLDFYWFGATTSFVTDGETTLAFDPFITRNTIWHFLKFKPVVSDPEYVKKWMNKTEIKQTDVVFVNHSHYDHAVDMIPIANMGTPSPIYAGPNGIKQARAQGHPESLLHVQKHGDVVQIGQFKVTIVQGHHPPHFLGITLACGELEKSFPENPKVYDYKLLEAFSYFIEHPMGNILFWPSSGISKKHDAFKLTKQADVVALGIAKRITTEDILETVAARVSPKVIIPTHHDNFLLPLEDGFHPLPTVNPEEFARTTREKFPQYKLIMPEFAKKITLYSKTDTSKPDSEKTNEQSKN